MTDRIESKTRALTNHRSARVFGPSPIGRAALRRPAESRRRPSVPPSLCGKTAFSLRRFRRQLYRRTHELRPIRVGPRPELLRAAAEAVRGVQVAVRID